MPKYLQIRKREWYKQEPLSNSCCVSVSPDSRQVAVEIKASRYLDNCCDKPRQVHFDIF